MKNKIFPAFLFLFFFTLPILAQDEEPEYEMKTYYFALLKKGPNRDMDSMQTAAIQEAHMNHIRQMAKDKKLVIAGPFLDDGDLRGIFIFDVGSLEEAKALAEQDPAVKAGRLIIEIHPWMSARGSTLP